MKGYNWPLREVVQSFFSLKMEGHRTEEESWIRDVFPFLLWWEAAETQQKTKLSKESYK